MLRSCLEPAYVLVLFSLLPVVLSSFSPLIGRENQQSIHKRIAVSPRGKSLAARRRTISLRDDSLDNGGMDHNLKREEEKRPLRPFAYIEPESKRPTETLAAQPEAEIMPSRPKIVVLGATGKIGRLVVRQLLESSELQAGATVVAFCRDYDKACRVLYDDLIVANNQRRCPKLQIIQGDLLSSDDVFASDNDKLLDDVDEAEWLQRAKSAANFYGTAVSDYDDGSQAPSSDDDGHEALRDAISGCSAIISCVGSVRPTNPWTDFVVKPLTRLLRKDVSGWCSDARHPYYTTYISTKKAVEFAEEEQQRREDAFSVDDSEAGRDGKEESDVGPPRIRFIRISDLCLEQKPWHLVPLLANVFHSMVCVFSSFLCCRDILQRCSYDLLSGISISRNGRKGIRGSEVTRYYCHSSWRFG